MINYHNKTFRPAKNSENGETSVETIFLYQQFGNIVTSDYSGGEIVKGHLMGIVDKNGMISMYYHQVNSRGELKSGVCTSTPEVLQNGKIRLHEKWQWTSGDQSKGESVIDEI